MKRTDGLIRLNKKIMIYFVYYSVNVILFFNIWIHLPDQAWVAVAFQLFLVKKTPSDRIRITSYKFMYHLWEKHNKYIFTCYWLKSRASQFVSNSLNTKDSQPQTFLLKHRKQSNIHFSIICYFPTFYFAENKIAKMKIFFLLFRFPNFASFCLV